MSESARTGNFDQSVLMSQASDMTRELRDQGETPEGILKSLKQVLDCTVITPPSKMKEAIVSCCIQTFFEK
jgi:hypothetical protein